MANTFKPVSTIILSLLVMGFLFLVIFAMFSKLKDTASANGYTSAEIAINETSLAVQEVTHWFRVLVLVAIMGVVLFFAKRLMPFTRDPEDSNDE